MLIMATWRFCVVFAVRPSLFLARALSVSFTLYVPPMCILCVYLSFTATEPNVSPNTDGINFYGGFDQLLEDSTISSGDDCVSVVPNGLDRQELCAVHPLLLECSGGNVVVRNTSCLGGHGISIGGVRHGSVSNVTFENMTAYGNVAIIFRPFLTLLGVTTPTTRRVTETYSTPCPSYRMLTGACNPMLCPIHVRMSSGPAGPGSTPRASTAPAGFGSNRTPTPLA